MWLPPLRSLAGRAATAAVAATLLAALAQPAAAPAQPAAAAAFPTALVRDIGPGRLAGDPRALTPLGDLLLFTAWDPAHGRELWRSDDTAAGTAPVLDIAAGPRGSNPSGLVAAGATVFFSAWDPDHGRELWASDGSAAGTRLLADIRPGPAGSDPVSLAPAAPPSAPAAGVMLSADDGVHGREPWASDGSAAGTRLLADVRPGPAGSDPSGFAALPLALAGTPATVAFAADDGSHGRELWRSDGSAAGTRLLADVRPGPAGSDPTWITGDSLFLGVTGNFPYVLCSADDGVHGREPVGVYDRLTALPSVFDLNPGPAASAPTGFRVFFFEFAYVAADDGVHGREPWRLNAPPLSPPGTPQGQPGSGALVADVRPGRAGSDPGSFSRTVDVGHGHVGPGPVVSIDTGLDRTFVDADDGVHGREPWRLVSEDFGPFGFVASHFVAGAGAGLVADLRPGAAGSRPGPAAVVGGQPTFATSLVVGGTALFAATDAARGRELWRSGGDARSSALVADLRPGAAGSSPRELTTLGDRVLFSADDGRHGRELWVVKVPPQTLTSIIGPFQPITAGTPTTFTIQVAGEPGAGTPTGTVTVSDGDRPVAVLQLGPGPDERTAEATWTVTLAPGTHHLTVSYPGDATFAPSAGGPWDASVASP